MQRRITAKTAYKSTTISNQSKTETKAPQRTPKRSSLLSSSPSATTKTVVQPHIKRQKRKHSGASSDCSCSYNAQPETCASSKQQRKQKGFKSPTEVSHSAPVLNDKAVQQWFRFIAERHRVFVTVVSLCEIVSPFRRRRCCCYPINHQLITFRILNIWVWVLRVLRPKLVGQRRKFATEVVNVLRR